MNVVSYIVYGITGLFLLCSIMWIGINGFKTLDKQTDKIHEKYGMLGVIIYISLVLGIILGFATYVVTEALMKGLK